MMRQQLHQHHYGINSLFGDKLHLNFLSNMLFSLFKQSDTVLSLSETKRTRISQHLQWNIKVQKHKTTDDAGVSSSLDQADLTLQWRIPALCCFTSDSCSYIFFYILSNMVPILVPVSWTVAPNHNSDFPTVQRAICLCRRLTVKDLTKTFFLTSHSGKIVKNPD